MVTICNGGGLLAVRQKNAVKFYKPNYPLKNATPFVLFQRGKVCLYYLTLMSDEEEPHQSAFISCSEATRWTTKCHSGSQ